MKAILIIVQRWDDNIVRYFNCEVTLDAERRFLGENLLSCFRNGKNLGVVYFSWYRIYLIFLVSCVFFALLWNARVY